MEIAVFKSCKTCLLNYERIISVNQLLNALEEYKFRLPFFDTPCNRKFNVQLIIDISKRSIKFYKYESDYRF